MRLKDLIGHDVTAPPGLPDVEIAGLVSDSRKVKPGFLFAALPGTRADGGAFIADALARGAVAILAGKGVEPPEPARVPFLEAAEPRRALARLAARFFGTQPRCAVAVTGTSGKTSVAEFTRQLFAALGHEAASLGTLGVTRAGRTTYGALTTPDPISLHAMLAGLAADGVTHVAFEASSHGLDQHRLDGVELTAGAFTNLGRDHLDYHPTVEAYLDAKLRLFRELLQPGRPAVVNADGARAPDVAEVARRRGLRLITVGEKGETLRLARLAPDGFGQRLEVVAGGRVHDLKLPLLGAYQAANALVAAGLVLGAGEPLVAALAGLERLEGVKGRLEIVSAARGGLVVVDYAHKPEALAAALEALRPFATGRLICVFGCGGDRDRGKRPIMGRIAVEKSDIAIVTDDNPRSERPEAIRKEILAGAPGAREIGDRAEAIAAAVAMLRPGDVVLIAGKGHETGQIVGDRVLPFSDQETARAALATA